jgi:hypothetical protein
MWIFRTVRFAGVTSNIEDCGTCTEKTLAVMNYEVLAAWPAELTSEPFLPWTEDNELEWLMERLEIDRAFE